ncbi:MAG: hypothetical protein JNK78_05470 [Planctomycetes bacterium]|nr:hypothetical protein [Planctomycetota bacterium]
MLFAGVATPIALESNGLRTMLRLGYGAENTNYAKTYRSAQEAAATELPDTASARQQSFTVMRAHGLVVCRATPACASCVVATECRSRRDGVRPRETARRAARDR